MSLPVSVFLLSDGRELWRNAWFPPVFIKEEEREE